MQNIGSYFWNFISKFGTQLLWIITTMVLARYLSPDDFGMIGVLSLIFMVANTLSEAGLGGALVIQKELKKDDCSTIFTFNLIVSIVLYVIVFYFADILEKFYVVDGLSIVTRVISLVFVINAFSCVPRTILYHRLQFKQLCIITIISVIVSSICSIIMAILGCGVYALVAYQLILAIMQVVGLFIVSKYRISLAFYWSNFKSLFSFGFFTTVCGVIDTIYENLLAAIYGKYFDMAQAGYLSQAKKIEEASTQALLSSVNNTSFPVLAKLKDSKQKFIEESLIIRKMIPIVIFPFLIVLMVFSREVIFILFGRQWLEAAPYLSMLIIAGMFMILDSATRNSIKSLGKVKELLYATFIKRVLACFLVLLFAYISTDLILYGYILGSIIGVLTNYFAYYKLGYISFLDVIKEFLTPMSWAIPLWIAIYLCYYNIPYMMLKIIAALFILFLFYYSAFKIYHIKISNLIKK